VNENDWHSLEDIHLLARMLARVTHQWNERIFQAETSYCRVDSGNGLATVTPCQVNPS
jgi:hypothetical protein